MRIAYVITRADAVGGASIHVRDLARAMRERGHETVVFVGGSGPVTELLTAAEVPFECLRHLRRKMDPIADARAFAELAGKLRNFGPDVVSAHTAKAGWLTRAACARLRIPCLYTPHGWSISDRISRAGGALFTVAERIAAHWSAAVVCVCDYERQLAETKRVVAPERLHVIHNGVHDIDPALRASPAEMPVRIVSIARFEPPKDHPTLLRALSSLRGLPWQLELIGDGAGEGKIRRLAAELGIADPVHFRGACADPAEALSRAQLFALSSRSEGFPRSILEAMRAGLPVVASRVGGVPEAVVEGSTGRLFDPGDVQGCARALKLLILNALERERLGAAGRHRYESDFRFGCMLEKTQKLYATIVG